MINSIPIDIYIKQNKIDEYIVNNYAITCCDTEK